MIFDESDLPAILDYNGERKWVEFKSPADISDKHAMARIVRGMMAMSNIEGGGLVIVGVVQTGNDFDPVGLDPTQLASWSNEDQLADRVAAWADPPLSYRLHQVDVDGRWFVVINVDEFEIEPIICRKTFGDVIHDGATYIRPRRKPESVPVRATADMRDLLRLATNKQLRDFLARAQQGGLPFGPTDTARFEEQRTNPQPVHAELDEVRSRGHWIVVVHPASFRQRIPYEDLETIVRACVVTLRGWDFPHIDHRTRPSWGQDSLSQGFSDWPGNQEVWRLWTTGQFVSERAFHDDWAAESPFPSQRARPPGADLGVLEALICLWEHYEFAARLALNVFRDDQVRVTVTAAGLQGRRLVVDEPGRAPFAFDYTAALDFYPDTIEVPAADLIANPGALAVQAAQRLFQRFGWASEEAVLSDALAKFQRSR